MSGLPPGVHILSWDWAEQPDLDDLATILRDLGVYLHQVDTRSDDYAIVLSRQPLSEDVVQAAWRAEEWPPQP